MAAEWKKRLGTRGKGFIIKTAEPHGRKGILEFTQFVAAKEKREPGRGYLDINWIMAGLRCRRMTRMVINPPVAAT